MIRIQKILGKTVANAEGFNFVLKILSSKLSTYLILSYIYIYILYIYIYISRCTSEYGQCRQTITRRRTSIYYINYIHII